MNGKVKLTRLQLKGKQQSKGTVNYEANLCKKEITTETKLEPSTNTTPVSRKNVDDDEQVSPFFMRFTQDSGDDEFDVVWDWDSPRSKGNPIHRKRLMHSSPNVPKRVAPSKNISRFNSLKAELEELANKLSDNNTSDKQTEVFLKPELPVIRSEMPDLFDDDSFDEDMIRCSLQVEEALNETVNNNSTNKLANRNFAVETIEDDSFDVFLEDVKEEELLSQISSSSNTSQNALNVCQNARTKPQLYVNASTIPKNLQYASNIPNHLQNASKIPNHLQNISKIPNNQQNASTISKNMQNASTIPKNMQNYSKIPNHLQNASTIPNQQNASIIPNHLQNASTIPKNHHYGSTIPNNQQNASTISKNMQNAFPNTSTISKNQQNTSTVPKNLQYASIIPNNQQNGATVPKNLQNASKIPYNRQNASTTPNKLQNASTTPNLQNGLTNSQSPRSISRYNSVPVTNKNLKNATLNQFQRTKSEEFSQKSTEMKCLPEEIEKKRQEARIKLEKKKKQWEIDRKRLEALERLKKNRLQRSKNNKVT